MRRALITLGIFFAFVAIYTLSRHATATSPTTSTTTPATTTTATTASSTLPGTNCQASGFSGVFNQGQGAAGTITASVTITKTSVGTCTLKGWPILTLQDKSGALLTSSTVDTSNSPPVQYPEAAANHAPTSLSLHQGSTTSFSLAYSDVPTGNEACGSARTLTVQFVAGGSSINVTPAYPLQPCNHGKILVSPFY
jgi:hypothetical protein